jgi:hypothetical protein
MTILIRGVYEIDAPEPCFLLEIEFDEPPQDFDWGGITQELAGQPRDNWQVPRNERPLNKDETRWIFFFHYLDLAKPLLTPHGPKILPPISPLPNRLSHTEYDPP